MPLHSTNYKVKYKYGSFYPEILQPFRWFTDVLPVYSVLRLHVSKHEINRATSWLAKEFVRKTDVTPEENPLYSNLCPPAAMVQWEH